MLFLQIRSWSIALIFFSIYFYVAGFQNVFGFGAFEFMILAIFGFVTSMVIGDSDEYSEPSPLLKAHHAPVNHHR